jgi:hypothetical protein
MSPEDRTAALAAIEKAREQAHKAARRAVRLECEYWDKVRATTPPCAPTRHDCAVIVGSVFTIYRCRVCGDEEWL